MKLRINGEEREVEAATVAELLRELAAPRDGVAVAVDEEVVPRARHGETALREGQRIEVIRAVGGG